MPRRKQPPPVIPDKALVASATRYPGSSARIYQPRQDWQQECYRHYSICGEARFAAQFFGHAVSRATLHPGLMANTPIPAPPESEVARALAQLFNGPEGQTAMLEAIGTHLTIAGECYLVGRSVEGEDVWEVVSVVEMRVTGSNWAIHYGDGQTDVQLTEQDVVIRIWLPHPARRIEADSPFRALLPILSEIEWLTRHVFAQVTSRLTGAGILMMPQGMSFPPPPDQPNADNSATVPPESNEANSFMLTLADAMMTPLQDPSSPAATVPIVVTAPDDAIDKARLLHFWSDLDSNAMSLRGEAIRRFALGMDLPPEQILGMSNNLGTNAAATGVSHWGAWQIEEATIKLHIEPMLDVICSALTMTYLRTATEDPTATIIYDTSALRIRPDRSREAFELWDRGVLSTRTLLKENGFDLTDLPADDEFRMWLLVKIASGSPTPEQVQSAVAQLGVELAAPLAPSPQNRPAAQPPGQMNPPSIPPPDRPRTPAGALVAASEALVFRALERAGNRLRQAGGKPPGVPSYETHLYIKASAPSRLLEDAWPCAAQVLDGIADAEQIVPVLDSYCQALISEQSPHKRARLINWLNIAAEKARA